jgi:Uma2 family endonuclease
MSIQPLLRLYTVEDLIALPDDGKRYELHDGEIVEVGTSSWKHARLGAWLIKWLGNYVDAKSLGGDVLGSDGTYKLTDHDTRVPDASYISALKTATLPLDTVFLPFAPDFAVEIKSPSNSNPDMHKAALLYLNAGTRLVWIVDPEVFTVTVYQADGQRFIVSKGGDLDGGDVFPGLKLSLTELFEKIAGM